MHIVQCIQRTTKLASIFSVGLACMFTRRSWESTSQKIRIQNSDAVTVLKFLVFRLKGQFNYMFEFGEDFSWFIDISPGCFTAGRLISWGATVNLPWGNKTPHAGLQHSFFYTTAQLSGDSVPQVYYTQKGRKSRSLTRHKRGGRDILYTVRG